VIQINVCDTRWRIAFVASGFPRLLAYTYTFAHSVCRTHTRIELSVLSSARAYIEVAYMCTASVCIGDAAHPPCDMRKLIVRPGIDALENQNPERPPDRSPSTRTHGPAVSCRAHSYPTDVRQPRPLVSRLRSSRDAHRFSRRASLCSAKAKSFLVTILARPAPQNWCTRSKLLIATFTGNIFLVNF